MCSSRCSRAVLSGVVLVMCAFLLSSCIAGRPEFGRGILSTDGPIPFDGYGGNRTLLADESNGVCMVGFPDDVSDEYEDDMELGRFQAVKLNPDSYPAWVSWFDFGLPELEPEYDVASTVIVGDELFGFLTYENDDIREFRVSVLSTESGKLVRDGVVMAHEENRPEEKIELVYSQNKEYFLAMYQVDEYDSIHIYGVAFDRSRDTMKGARFKHTISEDDYLIDAGVSDKGVVTVGERTEEGVVRFTTYAGTSTPTVVSLQLTEGGDDDEQRAKMVVAEDGTVYAAFDHYDSEMIEQDELGGMTVLRIDPATQKALFNKRINFDPNMFQELYAYEYDDGEYEGGVNGLMVEPAGARMIVTFELLEFEIGARGRDTYGGYTQLTPDRYFLNNPFIVAVDASGNVLWETGLIASHYDFGKFYPGHLLSLQSPNTLRFLYQAQDVPDGRHFINELDLVHGTWSIPEGGVLLGTQHAEMWVNPYRHAVWTGDLLFSMMSGYS